GLRCRAVVHRIPTRPGTPGTPGGDRRARPCLPEREPGGRRAPTAPARPWALDRICLGHHHRSRPYRKGNRHRNRRRPETPRVRGAPATHETEMVHRVRVLFPPHPVDRGGAAALLVDATPLTSTGPAPVLNRLRPGCWELVCREGLERS